MVDTVSSTLLEENPYNLGSNFGVYVSMQKHNAEKIPISQK